MGISSAFESISQGVNGVASSRVPVPAQQQQEHFTAVGTCWMLVHCVQQLWEVTASVVVFGFFCPRPHLHTHLHLHYSCFLL